MISNGCKKGCRSTYHPSGSSTGSLSGSPPTSLFERLLILHVRPIVLVSRETVCECSFLHASISGGISKVAYIHASANACPAATEAALRGPATAGPNAASRLDWLI